MIHFVSLQPKCCQLLVEKISMILVLIYFQNFFVENIFTSVLSLVCKKTLTMYLRTFDLYLLELYAKQDNGEPQTLTVVTCKPVIEFNTIR